MRNAKQVIGFLKIKITSLGFCFAVLKLNTLFSSNEDIGEQSKKTIYQNLLHVCSFVR